MTTLARRCSKHYGHNGHDWQGRFKVFPTQDDEHLETVARHIERNLLLAARVARAENWPWSSLGARGANAEVMLERSTEPPLRRGDRTEFVKRPLSEPELEAVRSRGRRGQPNGAERWWVAPRRRG